MSTNNSRVVVDVADVTKNLGALARHPYGFLTMLVKKLGRVAFTVRAQARLCLKESWIEVFIELLR